MRIYLAGPMRGKPDRNYPAFYRAATILRGCGHEVFNPAESQFNALPVDTPLPEDYNNPARREALNFDLAWIALHADAVALLPGWHDSKGARAERATAEAIGLKIFYIPEQYDWAFCNDEPIADAEPAPPTRFPRRRI